MKVLFAGLGSIGQRHLRNILTLSEESVELLAWRVTRSAPLSHEAGQVTEGVNVAAHYGVREFDDLDAALAEAPDIAFITNPNSRHIPVARAAVAAGCDLFVEKPLSHDAEGVAELMTEVEAAGCVAAVGYQYRLHPGLVLAKQWLDDGRIGSPVSARFVNGEYMPDWHPYEDYRQSYGARRDLGGGALVSQIHEFDLAYWMFGLPDLVFAVGGQLSNLEIDVEDTVSVLMRANFDGHPLPVSVDLDYLQSPPVRSCTIVGDEGRIVWHEQQKSVTLERVGEGPVEERRFEAFERNSMFMDEMRCFLEAVETRGAAAVDLRSGVDSLRLALTAREAMLSGQACALVGID